MGPRTYIDPVNPLASNLEEKTAETKTVKRALSAGNMSAPTFAGLNQGELASASVGRCTATHFVSLARDLAKSTAVAVDSKTTPVASFRNFELNPGAANDGTELVSLAINSQQGLTTVTHTFQSAIGSFPFRNSYFSVADLCSSEYLQVGLMTWPAGQVTPQPS